MAGGAGQGAAAVSRDSFDVRCNRGLHHAHAGFRLDGGASGVLGIFKKSDSNHDARERGLEAAEVFAPLEIGFIGGGFKARELGFFKLRVVVDERLAKTVAHGRVSLEGADGGTQ